ncbi:ABC transporter substrate-binding protein [Homoserinibacter sp. GY 40078]|uniref:ABC transporter substrate-binding protein n=1 Tax=Homoserinibacter sp. GY 40078 TaxID=2603275 RepID=UPI0011CA5909|nr:extracellular solute-binding protein [Homoserinibacter sp. GY 40078]TXK19433.1 extracellular solute-binding protein [Homoserinibacter sp. GY 40078]
MTTARQRRLGRRSLALAATATSALLLAACAAGPTEPPAEGTDPEKLEYLVNVENGNIPPVLEDMSTGVCSAENEDLPLEINSIPQADLDGQIQLLVGQDALPAMFAAGGTPAEGAKLWNAGKLVDFDEALDELGVLDQIEPAAISTIKQLYGGAFSFLPFQYNIEGIFYNKALFAEYGIEEPQTWDELLAASATFKENGIIPLTASGEQGWPITRLLSGYIFRSLGPDALQKVADGEAKLTDEGYVEAAQAIADLGASGYLNDNIASLDYDGAQNEFLNGNAAMFYMGTWALTAVNNPEANKIGVENVGFMPFPGVEGGAGDISQYPSNVGLPSTFGSATFGPKVQAWTKCITENFGEMSLVDQNTISGFKVSDEVWAEQPQLTQDVHERIASSTQSVLWFEALFNAKAGQDSSKNVPLLVTGQMSPEEFMQLLQTDLDAG